MSVSTTTTHPDVLDPRFREIEKEMLGDRQSMISKLCTEATAKLEVERGSEITGMGQFQLFTGVGAIVYDTPSQGYDWSATNVEYAKGTQVERRLLRWDQMGVVEEFWRDLYDSQWDTQETHVALFLNEGFDVSNLLNFSHTRSEALFANTHASGRAGVSSSTGRDNLATAALSRTSLNSMAIQAANFRDDTGRPKPLKLNQLWVPPDLGPTAREIVNSPKVAYSSDNTVNLYSGIEVVEWEYLTDANDFFFLNGDATKKNLCWFWGDRPEYNRVKDFDTFIIKYSGYMSYTSAWKRPFIGVGAQVS